MKINKQINMVILVSMAAFLLISILLSYNSLNNLKNQEIDKMRATLLSERKNQLRDVVKNAYSVLETANFYAPAQEAISNMRFGENGQNYFFIVDPTGMFWVDPAHPEMVGKVNKDLTDAKGMRYIEQIITNAYVLGEGYLKYYDYKSGSDTPSVKLVHFKRFKNWDWILCASIFIDDIESSVAGNQAEINSAMMGQIRQFIIFGLLTLVVAVFFSTRFFMKKLVQPIQHLTTGVEQMINGNFNVDFNIKSNREINLLVNAMERMQDSFAIAYKRLKANTEKNRQENLDASESVEPDTFRGKTKIRLKTVG